MWPKLWTPDIEECGLSSSFIVKMPSGISQCTRTVTNSRRLYAGGRLSGRADLNRRPPAPHAGALTGLRYAPMSLEIIVHREW